MTDEVDKLFTQALGEVDIFVKAKILRILKDKYGLRTIDLARGLDIKSSYVCHILRLNKLPSIIIDGYYSKTISISHLFLISRLNREDDMVKVYEKVLTENLTVAQTEESVREILYSLSSDGEYLSPELRDLLIQKLEDDVENLNVKIIQTRTRSRLIYEVKGSLEVTTPIIRKIAETILGVNTKKGEDS